MKLRIYLSGSIKKGKNDNNQKSYWTDDEIGVLRNVLSNKYELVFLNPAVRSDDLSDFKSTFGRDLLQVFVSDLILVDARTHKGIGIGSEMTFAKLNNIPVITIAPTNSKYIKENFEYLGQSLDKWVHPFIGGLSDYILESVEEAADFILNNFPFKEGEIKDKSYFYSSMQHYINTQLENDSAMYDCVKKDDFILGKIKKIGE